MGKKARKPTTAPAEEPVASDGGELPERWSMQRKTELVLRLLRGEPFDAVSRDSQVPAHELERWERVFLETGPRGLKTRAEPEERELTLARAKIGELMMRLELAEHLIEKGGSRTSGRGPGDEGGAESEYEPALSADHDLPGVADGAFERLCERRAAGCPAEVEQARAEDPGQRPRPGRRDPPRLERGAVPRRRRPEGAGAAGPPRRGGWRQTRPAADAPASAPGAAPAGPTERGSRARRDDHHHHAAQRDVGH
jgi:hypothetical protein